ncbi:MAG: ACT domain-containing protein [Cyclobacteriaceae bacterium]
MTGEKKLTKILKKLKPVLCEGDYVYCTTGDVSQVSVKDIVMIFREDEGATLIVKKETADRLKLGYSLVTSWITLTVHSSLAAVGLTAAFSQALTDSNISCNVVAGYYHDHIFVPKKDAGLAMQVLGTLSQQ